MAHDSIHLLGSTSKIVDGTPSKDNGISSFTVTVGGMTVNEHKGNNCVFVTSGNAYAVISNTADAVVLRGDASAEAADDVVGFCVHTATSLTIGDVLTATGACSFGFAAANVSKVFCDTYDGDDANDRELDLGDDYDLVLVFLQGSAGFSQLHLAMAWALGPSYGVFYTHDTPDAARHMVGPSANTLWQGKMTGADATKIKLGSTGNAAEGTNKDTYDYHILALKFGTVNTF